MSKVWTMALTLSLLLGACSSDDDDGSPVKPDDIEQSVACARYIDCLQITAQDDVSEAIVSFGAASPCWDGAEQAAECTADCTTGLLLQYEANPEVTACAECEVDADCSEPTRPYCVSSGACMEYECGLDEDCTGDEVCKIVGTIRACELCEVDEDCPFDELCADPGTSSARCLECLEDSDCPDTFTCNEETNRCDL